MHYRVISVVRKHVVFVDAYRQDLKSIPLRCSWIGERYLERIITFLGEMKRVDLLLYSHREFIKEEFVLLFR